METVVKRFNELTLDELYRIVKLRVDVFVVEQNCPYSDLDDLDQDAIHVFVKENDEILAYLRVLNNERVKIGRVISARRGEGLGKIVLDAGIKAAKELLDPQDIFIHAQTYARGFYEKAGFEVCGEEFLEDDIPHLPMILKLK